ncbi:hypothetical protein RND81_04G246900 [Saponaria officinalis]|uniref:Uncharacterized protein n=1 Tax=Saponaria officinalis TaxID=3572 RepID=A0AAW1LPN5_SAPOF
MGTLIGHVGPGFGFMVIGVWHLYNHLKILAQHGASYYKSQPWFPLMHGLLRRLELYLIICGCTLSVAMELFIGPDKHQPLDADGTIPSNHLHNFEHSSISLTFLVYALFALALDKWATKPMPAQDEVVQVLGGLAFWQQLLLFHLHSADHMGVEGQYHWLLQLVVFSCLATTLMGVGRGRTCFAVGFVRSLSIMFQGVWLMVMGFALWTPALIPKGCFMNLEDGHKVVRCQGEGSLHRAKALVNIQFSWFLIFMAAFAAASYVSMMLLYGNNNNNNKYSVMSLSEQEDDEDVEAPKQQINQNLVQSHNTNKPIHHMER